MSEPTAGLLDDLDQVPLRRLWPRRSSDLPPGQRRLAVFPRFSDDPRRPPPPDDPGRTTIALRAEGEDVASIDLRDLPAAAWVDQTSDLHCVTTWSVAGLRWAGASMRPLWTELVERVLPAATDCRFVVAAGADAYRAVFLLDDLLAPGVLVATSLDRRPLDARHGAPMRLVSPAQYGYKSVKHLVALDLRREQPASALGAKEHLRARVALEERHSRLPARLLRVPYRLVVPVTARVAERSLARRTSAGSRD